MNMRLKGSAFDLAELESLSGWFDERSSAIVKPIQAKAFEIVRNIRKTADNLDHVAAGFISGKEKAIADKYANRLAEEISSSLARVEYPTSITPKTLQRLSMSLRQSLVSIEEAAAGSFPKLKSFMVKFRLRNLDSKFKALRYEAETLDNFIRSENARIKKIEDTHQKIDQLRSMIDRAEKLLSSIENVLASKEVVAVKLRNLEEKLQTAEMSARKVQVEQALGQASARLGELLDPLRKPMKKAWKQLKHDERAPHFDQMKILEHFPDDSVRVFLSIRNLESFDALLRWLSELIKSGTLGLKQSKAVRALDHVKRFAEEAPELRRVYQDLQHEKDKLETLVRTEQRISGWEDLQRQIESLEKEDSRMRVDYENSCMQIELQKKQIADAIEQTLGERIEFPKRIE